MAFWKKSEDPWDMAPDKRRPTVRAVSYTHLTLPTMEAPHRS